MSKKIIAWEHWNSIEIEDPVTNLSEDKENEEDNNDDTYDYSDNLNMLPIMDTRPNFITTPFGQYPIESKLKPSDRWDCWIGHTNFTITDEIALIIEEVEGISALRIMDRYSFCIGVGKLFNIQSVRSDIENILCISDSSLLEKPEIKEAIGQAKILIGNKKFWSIYVSSNGDVTWIGEDDVTEEYLEAIEYFEQLKTKDGGFILSSEE
jgi:hypothetical protein